MQIFENFNFKKIGFNKYNSNETSFKRYEIILADFSLPKWLIRRFLIAVTLFTLLFCFQVISEEKTN